MKSTKILIALIILSCISTICTQDMPTGLNFLEGSDPRQNIIQYAVDISFQSALVRNLFLFSYNDKNPILHTDKTFHVYNSAGAPKITTEEGVWEFKPDYAKWTVNMSYEFEGLDVSIANKNESAFKAEMWFNVS
jgi:hypothetical protein